MKLNNIDLNKLNVFYCVMQLNGYAGAAKELNVTKSAVSQSITNLEAQLGVSLFLRKSKKLIPTDDAQKLFAELKIYHKNLLSTVQSISDAQDSVQGLVRIGAYLEFAKKELSPFLKKFLSSNPEVQVKFKFESPSRLKDLLERGKLDLAFSIFPIKGVKGILSKKVLKEELVMICKKGDEPNFKSVDDFLKAKHIAYYTDQGLLQRWFRLHFSKRPSSLKVPLFAATAEMVVSTVREGIGLGVVPGYMVDDGVSVLRPTDEKLEDFIWLNYYYGQYSNTAHKAFVKEALEGFKL